MDRATHVAQYHPEFRKATRLVLNFWVKDTKRVARYLKRKDRILRNSYVFDTPIMNPFVNNSKLFSLNMRQAIKIILCNDLALWHVDVSLFLNFYYMEQVHGYRFDQCLEIPS